MMLFINMVMYPRRAGALPLSSRRYPDLATLKEIA
jgi:hypothetical protein